jgi:hypothetical protein
VPERGVRLQGRRQREVASGTASSVNVRKGEDLIPRLFLCEDFLPPLIRNFSFMLTNQPDGIINSEFIPLCSPTP